MRAVLLDRDDLDALLKRHKQALEAAGGGP
jgi:hypothetical protein